VISLLLYYFFYLNMLINLLSISFLSLGSVPLRANLEQTLKPLAFHGVPLTIFCAGYGDVAAQVLALSTPGT
jgi:hypothetical protein